MKTGIVAWYDVKLGYGFIARGAGEKDLFVHFSGLADRDARIPVAGDAVVFDIEVGLRGPKAVNARILAGPGGEPQPAAVPERR
ncbi:cold-shock protein [Nocardia macrotermitis]|uniref:CSD domain-containing protein n=1 Tax=Nocardia macrotermitis TaxID=2585198 RepID=A0A7K0DGB4_9NOCA|nr:cold shock domain-containing protein [Nocardia macrotermitis]MQY24342.1 hypothetical protein [Nocardia macrotermitis]